VVQSNTATNSAGSSASEVREHIASFDWAAVRESLNDQGYARLPGLLSVTQCEELIALYSKRERFRSFIDMGPRRYGEGTYRYFANPLPALVRSLRTHVYSRLVPVANGWNESLSREERYPASLRSFLAECHHAGQARPTPLLLHYEVDGFNCMHRDVYGAIAFPLQLACLLSPSVLDADPGFSGGEFLIGEQRPRQQTRVEAVTLRRGEGLIFANQFRPVVGARGVYRAWVRHGVSRIGGGERFALGVIFHDGE
jgi:hypothetical protein